MGIKRILYMGCFVLMSCGAETDVLETEIKNLKTHNEILIERVDSLDARLKALESEMEAVRQKSKPGTGVVSSSVTRNVNAISSYGGRCQAITKKGTQCKRYAEAGRNFCWQH